MTLVFQEQVKGCKQSSRSNIQIRGDSQKMLTGQTKPTDQMTHNFSKESGDLSCTPAPHKELVLDQGVQVQGE